MAIESPFPDLVVPKINFANFLLSNLQKHPENKPALISADKRYTYCELIKAIQNCKNLLLQKGIKKNDVIALSCPNICEFVICLIATASLGGITTTCNPLSTSYELVRQFKDSKPKLVFTILEHSEKFLDVHKACEFPLDVVYIGESQQCISFKNSSLFFESSKQLLSSVEINAEKDILLLPYSSGTTGLPKGVMLSHYNLTSSVLISKINWHLSNHDVEYLVIPLFHIYGFLRSLSALNQGATVVLDQRFDLNKMGHAIQTYKVTSFPIVPPMLLSISKSDIESKYDLTSLRMLTIGAAPIAPDLLLSVTKKLNCYFTLAWGMTETTGVSVIMNNMVWGISPKSSGKLCPMNLAKVCDVETGKELGPNQKGEIMVKGPEVMIGYYNRPEATAKIFDEDGFLHTGDIGYYDELQQLYVVDRVKELIKYKGFQVAPAEIEHVLMNHSKVKDAAVIGVPHNEAGEVAKAFIVKKNNSLTVDDIHDYLKSNLSKYKQLHGGVEFVDKIPKSPSGKILRRLLRETFKAKL